MASLLHQTERKESLPRAFINGVSVEIEPNDTILKAARRAGIFIPTLCEFAALNHTPGTCRVCLVEVEKLDGTIDIVTSCETRIEPGMRIRTRTPEVRRRQKLQMELLFADHDENCSSCSRHGNCELQKCALWVGLDGSHISGRHCAPRVEDMSQNGLRFDGRKCIRCLRCIEVCRQVQGPLVSALVLKDTGAGAQIGFRGTDTWAKSDICIQCGQCSLVCPTGALSERDECCKVFDMFDDDSLTTIIQFAPAVRVAVAEAFALPVGTNVEAKIVTALKHMGADYVMDTRWSADVTILEEGTEMLTHFEEQKKAGTLDKPFTYFTSCCPGWINYVEKIAPDMIPHISSTRSPQAIFAALAKTYMAKKAGLEKKNIRVISIMPCTAKKDEAARKLLAREDGSRDTDVVLTVRELIRLIRRSGLNLAELPDTPFDSPEMSVSSGGAMLFATTGGVMEAAIRTMNAIKNNDPRPLPPLEMIRGPHGIKEATVKLGDLGDIRVAVVHECSNVAHVIDMVRNGTAPWHFVEVMACPNGCVGGGGTPRGHDVWGRNSLIRQQSVYKIDAEAPIHASHENPEVIRLYQEFLGEPCGHLSHELLHCTYEDRSRKSEVKPARKVFRLEQLHAESGTNDGI
ncbi:[FeFe] hydrogenase, group A [Sutterella sp.]|uniref:[FeFe] hydrogenase, group A n=1 Tax=Sutterella sp. TaxID=1981025 RepID=UPI0026E0E55B|nr:[FeFe] hydrogenase, group A [Sutterella sp.]MDO5531354.1 [FeFe] hydrogenase, group A [Sutterella sp.]